MQNLLNDARKFEKIDLKNGILSFAVKQKKCVDNIQKSIVMSNSISEQNKEIF